MEMAHSFVKAIQSYLNYDLGKTDNDQHCETGLYVWIMLWKEINQYTNLWQNNYTQNLG